MEGFEKVPSKRRAAETNPNRENKKDPQTLNRYETLGEIMASEEESAKYEKATPAKEGKKDKEALSRKGGETKEVTTDKIMLPAEDMELGELDLEGIEKACDDPKDGYIPFNHIILLQEALIKTKGARGLGVVTESMKGGENKRRGRRSNMQRVQDVGESWWPLGSTQ